MHCREEVSLATTEHHKAKEELSDLARQSERRAALENQVQCLACRGRVLSRP